VRNNSQEFLSKIDHLPNQDVTSQKVVADLDRAVGCSPRSCPLADGKVGAVGVQWRRCSHRLPPLSEKLRQIPPTPRISSSIPTPMVPNGASKKWYDNVVAATSYIGPMVR